MPPKQKTIKLQTKHNGGMVAKPPVMLTKIKIMILPFSQYFDKEKSKPTYFDDKICKSLLDNGFEFSGEHETTPYYLQNCFHAKIHTIRRDEKNRWKQGKKVHAVFNNRTKNQFQFAPTFECNGTQQIEILWMRGTIYIAIDDRVLDYNERVELSKNDGFESYEDFRKWFNSDFKGKIIHFTDFRY